LNSKEKIEKFVNYLSDLKHL